MIQRLSGRSRKGKILAVVQHNDPDTHKQSSEDQPVFVVQDGTDVLVQTFDWRTAFRFFQNNRS
jgi:hypothetical protein